MIAPPEAAAIPRQYLIGVFPDGHVLAIDADSNAIDAAQLRLNRFQTHLTLAHGSYTNLGGIINANGFGPARRCHF